MTGRRGPSLQPWPSAKVSRAQRAIDEGVPLGWVAERFGVSTESLRRIMRVSRPPDSPPAEPSKPKPTRPR